MLKAIVAFGNTAFFMDLMFGIISFFLALIVAWLLVQPVFSSAERGETLTLSRLDEQERFSEALAELEEERLSGKISREEYAEAKRELAIERLRWERAAAETKQAAE